MKETKEMYIEACNGLYAMLEDAKQSYVKGVMDIEELKETYNIVMTEAKRTRLSAVWTTGLEDKREIVDKLEELMSMVDNARDELISTGVML